MREFLLKHNNENPAAFHMPGHKGDRLFRRFGYDDFLDNIAGCDITEIPGADNLFQAESIIKGTMEKYRKLYGSRQSYLLVNGTSGGLIASVLAAVPSGGKLILARNCHKSVFNAMRLGSISPVYAYPQMIEEYGIMGEVSADEIRRCIEENPDASAVILPSPNYYGICSDISLIADICHEAGKVLIVDQAHGAHLKFMDEEPPAAEDCGADLIVNSIHKTLCSFTQSAVLNLCSNRVDKDILEDRLQMIQSTSPSYLLMACLDVNADMLLEHKDVLMAEWEDNIKWFYEEAEKIAGLKIMKADNLDRTKINIDYGMSGSVLEEKLMEKAIYSELNTGNILMLMTGIGNTRSDYERLVTALKEIEPGTLDKPNECGSLWLKKREIHKTGNILDKVKLDDAEGRICGASVIPYPPGIPLICPGEKIEREEIEYIKTLRSRGDKVIGINDNEEVVVTR